MLVGTAALVAAWFTFSLHDAAVKLLVADMSAWQVLFFRSVAILPFCVTMRWRGGVGALVPARTWRLLFLNAAVYAMAWVAYYTAARGLQLAELETIYYASPLLTTFLALVLLGERVPRSRWLANAVGLLGVILACGPVAPSNGSSVLLALAAAALWAVSVVLMRHLSAAVSTATQMLMNNLVFLALCVISLPLWWRTPLASDLGPLALIAGAGLLAQYLLFEGLRRVPASLAAPLEYTGLLWAFALGSLIWGDVPAIGVALGAGLITVSGLLAVLGECRAERPAATDDSVGLDDVPALKVVRAT
jgi:drug/metabolite transporter (DMT)-like permease